MIVPIPLQGGVQTIQQSIYLTHNNPCGFNPWLATVAGDTGFTFNDMANLLQDGINLNECLDALSRLQQAVAIINSDPSQSNVLEYLDAFFTYGFTIWDKAFKDLKIDGYRTAFSCYEANGTTIFDSEANPAIPPTNNEFLSPVYRDPSGNLNFTEITLITPQPFTFNESTYSCTTPRSPFAIFPVPFGPVPPGSPCTPLNCIPPNPYCVLSLLRVRLYGILQTPAYWPYIWDRLVPGPIDVNQRLLFNSSYLSNESAQPESVMAISSILVDTANTRYLARPRFGFSSRIYRDTRPSFHVSLLMFLTNTDQASSFFQNLQDLFFVRLSFIKIP